MKPDYLTSLPDESVAAPKPISQAEAVTPPAIAVESNYLESLPDESTELSKAFQSIPSRNPDHAAKVIDLAKKTGQPEDFIDENMQEAEEAVKARPDDYWLQVEREYPGTTKWLKEEKNMAVAHDDVDNLAKRERLIEDVGESIKYLLDPGARIEAADRAFRGAIKKAPAGFTSGTLQVRQSELGWNLAMKALTTGEHDTQYDAELSEIEKKLAEYSEKKIGFNPFYYAAQQIPNLLMMGKYGLKRGMQGGLAFGAGAFLAGQIPPFTGLPEEAVTVPAATALGFRVGGRIGAFEAMAILEGGLAYSEYAALKDKNGNPINPRLAAEMAIATGLSNAGLEYFSMSALLRTIPGGERILGLFKAKDGPFRALKPGVGVREAVKRYLTSIGAETATEAAQEGVGVAVGEIGKKISGRPFEPISGKEIFQRIYGVIGPAAQATMLLGIPGTVLHVAGEFNKFKQSDIGREAYDHLGKMADESKLLKRSPEAYADHLNKLAEGTGLQNVYIPPAAFNEYCQKNNLDPKDLSAKLGIDTLYQEAIENRSDIKIPSGDWTVRSKIVGEEIGRDLYAEMSQDVKNDPDSYTKREINELTEHYQEQFKNEANRIIAEDPAQESAKQRIYEQRYSQLLEAGRPEKEAKAAAELFANMSTSLAANIENLTPEQANALLVSRIRGVEDIEVPGRAAITPEISELAIEEARKKLYSDTKIEVSAQPEFLATEYLRKNLGPGYRRIAIRATEEDILSKEHRQTFESAAVAFGLGDAEALVKLISEMPTREQAIQEMLDVKLSYYFGDPKHYQYAGKQLEKAKEMEAEGKTPEEIQQNTGWIKDREKGYWRYSPAMSIFGPNALYQMAPPVESEAFKKWFGDSKVVDKFDFKNFFQMADQKAAKPLMLIYSEITDHVLDMRAKYSDEKLSKPLHDIVNKKIANFGKIYKLEKESKEFADWLRENARHTDREMLYQKMQDIFGLKQAAAGAFDPRSRDIVLSFKNANASTFIHETAHAWLGLVDEMVKEGRASESLTSDHTKLMAWLGAEYDKPLTKEQHERFASAFEAYLREGKAPVAELRSAFARFKRWLTMVYRSVLDIGGGILGAEGVSPEVKEIMDRMLATEEEIKSAERNINLSEEMKFEWLEPKVAKRLDNLRQQAHNEATNKLLKAQMEEIKADRKAFLKSERARITGEVTETLGNDPLHLSIKSLAKNEKAAKKLAEQYISDQIPEGSEDFINFEVTAEINGFYSGEELAKFIIAKKPFKKEVADEVERRMTEAYSDLKDTDAIRDEAMNAVHSDRQLEVMALEREILKAKVELAEGKEYAYRHNMVKIWMEAEIAKTQAIETVARLPIGEIKSPVKYFTAERLAAVRVANAMSRKDYTRAAQHKHIQLLNHALGMAVIKSKKEIDQALKRIKKIGKLKPENLLDEELYSQVHHLLNRFGFLNYSLRFKRADTLSQYLKGIISEFQGEEKDESIPLDLPEWILDEAIKIDKADLTLSQLYDVQNALKNLIHTAKMIDKFYALAEKGNIAYLASRLTKEALSNVKRRKRGRAVEKKLEKYNAVVNNYKFSLEQADTVFNRLDGWNDFGFWYKTLSEPVKNAADLESKRRWELIAKLDEIWGVYTPSEIEKINDKKIIIPEFGLNNANPFYKHQLLAMALNLGNKVNRDKLMNNKPVNLYPDFEWNIENRENTERIVMDVLQKHLDKRDWQFVQNIWNLIGSLKEDAFATHKRVTGFEPQSVEAVPFEVILPSGEKLVMDGGYYPLDEDPRHSEKAAERELLDQPLYKESNPGFKAMTKTGHTKPRTEAQYAVSLRLSLISRHLTDVIHDIYFREIVIDLRRLASNQNFVDGVKSAIGDQGYKFINTWIKSVASGRNAEKFSADAMSATVRGINRRSAGSIILMRTAVILQNFANPLLAPGRVKGFGYGAAARAIIGRGILGYWYKSVLGGVGWKAAADMRNWVWSLSSFMRDRRENPAYTLKIYQGVASRLGVKGKIKDFFIGLLAASDDMTNIPMWIEAFSMKMKETGNQKEAVNYADLLISRITPSARKYDVAQTLRSGADIPKLLNIFYSFWNVEYNNWVRELGKQGREPLKNAPRFMGFVASRALFVLTSAILANHKPDPDWDDDKKRAWWIKEFAIYPISFFPGIRDVAGLILDNALGLPSYGYRPFLAAGVIENLGKAAIKIKKRATGEASDQELVESLAKIMSVAFPYPDQLNTWFFNAYDIIVNRMEPTFDDLYRRRSIKKR